MKKLKEIAAMAGVSPATVSFVLNDRPGVSDEKRREIGELLTQNGYKLPSGAPAAPAKMTLRFIKYKRHGMLVDGNPGFVNSIVDAIELECRRQNCSLYMTACDQSQLPGIADAIKDDPADGVLFLGTELTTEEAQSYLSDCGVPLVVLDTDFPLSDLNCVTMNNAEGIFRAAEHLYSLGHRDIGFLANSIPSNNCQERLRAYLSALDQLGLERSENLIFKVHPTPEGAYDSIRQLLLHGVSFPSAVIANNDSIALGCMKAFREAEIKVPEDVSIIGFDDISAASLSAPALSTLGVSCLEMGIWAVRLLCDRIRYPFSASTKMLVSTNLIARGSTAPRKV